MVWDVLKFVFGWIPSLFGDRRRLRLTVHKAFFEGDSQRFFFVNLTNLSRSREVEITHVWFDCEPKVYVRQSCRLLPKRLKPDETWEIWIAVEELPDGIRNRAYTLARARLSTGKTVKSKRAKDVPEEGAVPGGLVVVTLKQGSPTSRSGAEMGYDGAVVCPVCDETANSPTVKLPGDAAVFRYICPTCGGFGLSYAAQSIAYCGEDNPKGVQGLPADQREALSRAIVGLQDDENMPVLTSSDVREFTDTGALPPTVTTLPITPA